MNFFVDHLLNSAEGNGSARYEVKFVIPRNKISRLRHWVLSSPLKFSNTFPQRKITSLYLDSWDFRSYRDNLDGTSARAKIRIRHYGTNVPNEMYLESKLRRAQTGYKLRYPITDSALVNQIATGTISDARARNGWIRKLAELDILAKPLALSLPTLFPTAEVAYDREYYVTLDGRIRLTIDTGIQYRRAGSLAGKFLSDPLSICEIKTNADPELNSLFPVPSLPFRVSRNSKYCCAVSSVCQDLVPPDCWQPYV